MKKRGIRIAYANLLMACAFPLGVAAQDPVGPEKGSLANPVGIPMFLAGNFGEPRLNHFHSGIDIKTNGTIGIPVQAVEDGYVSRIKVEPGGYGNALYIRHKNGFTSLSGHLSGFTAPITRYVKEQQYRRESFTVDLFPDPSAFPVKKGQVVAYSGNSGSSEGPHLHFELRETESENPVNPLVRAVTLKDDIPPVISKIDVYSLSGHGGWMAPVTVPLHQSAGRYVPATAAPVPLDTQSGIGIETYDLINGSDNHCGVYRIIAKLDGQPFFESDIDEFSFAETRYMNSFMDYGSYVTKHRTILKLFIDPNNQAGIYRYAKNRGRLEPGGNRTGKITITVRDAAGNESVAEFSVRTDPSRFKPRPEQLPLYSAYFSCREPNSYSTDHVEMELPAGALYNDLFFNYEEIPGPKGSYSPLARVHRPDVPVHLFYRLSIAADDLPESLKPKAAIVQITDDHDYNCIGGTWEGNRLVARVRSFGDFTILADTVPPVLEPANFSSDESLKTLKSFRFRAEDRFSGLSSYRGEIDGKWILLENDAKNSILEYTFDPERVRPGIRHRMVIRVSDQLGNTTVRTWSFNR